MDDDFTCDAVIEEFATDILEVFYLGNDDGGFGNNIYGLSTGQDLKDQLKKIYALVKKYFL